MSDTKILLTGTLLKEPAALVINSDNISWDTDVSFIDKTTKLFLSKSKSLTEKFNQLIEQLEEQDKEMAQELKDLIDLKEGVQNELNFALEQYEDNSNFGDEDWYAAKINALCHAQGISAENYVPDRSLDHEREKELFGY